MINLEWRGENLIILTIFLILFAASPSFAQISEKSKEPEAADKIALLSHILNQMEQAGKNLTDFKADFRQVKVFTQFDDRVESSGKVTYKKGGKILWEFEKPSSDKLTINKGIAWLYSPKMKQVQKVDLKDKAQTESLLLGFGSTTAEIRDSYEVNLIGADKVNQKDVYVLELIPKNKNLSSYFSKVTLWIDRDLWLPVKTQLLESNEDTTTIEFHSIQLNTHVADSVFDFKVPREAEVIDYSK
jgi:outer membrane lipoprotein-sorting protein